VSSPRARALQSHRIVAALTSTSPAAVMSVPSTRSIRVVRELSLSTLDVSDQPRGRTPSDEAPDRSFLENRFRIFSLRRHRQSASVACVIENSAGDGPVKNAIGPLTAEVRHKEG